MLTHSTAAVTNQALDQSRDAGLLDTTHHLTGSALDKSRLLDISSVDASQEESKSEVEISEFQKASDNRMKKQSPEIRPLNEIKQAGYSTLLDTLQIYDAPSEVIKPIDLEPNELKRISELCIDEVQMSKQELAQIKQAAWTPMHDSLQQYEEFAQNDQKQEFQQLDNNESIELIRIEEQPCPEELDNIKLEDLYRDPLDLEWDFAKDFITQLGN